MDSHFISKEKEELIQKNLLLLKYKVQEQRLEKVWEQFEEAGFNPILIKGWAVAQKYPNPSERLYVDIDLIFSPEEFDKAEIFYSKNTFEFSVDLHRGARHLDSLEFSQLYNNSILKLCGKRNIRILSEEDHFRILCVHWLNDGGAYKEKLWDIYNAFENRYENFNWEKCLDVVEHKRRFWIICAIGITNRYLGLNVESFPFKKELEKIPSWIYKAIEKEWADEVRLSPLANFRHDRKKLWQQIKKRFPPNPIQATIEVNGSFNNTPRIFYQFADIFKRLFTSWKRTQKFKYLRSLQEKV